MYISVYCLPKLDEFTEDKEEGDKLRSVLRKFVAVLKKKTFRNSY